jgi:hypothetical protein
MGSRYQDFAYLHEFRYSFLDRTLCEKVGNHYSLDTNVLLHALGINWKYNELTVKSTREACYEWLKHAKATLYQPILTEFENVLESFRSSFSKRLGELNKESKKILKFLARSEDSKVNSMSKQYRANLESLNEEKKLLSNCEYIVNRDKIVTLQELLDGSNFRIVRAKENLVDQIKELNSSLFSKLTEGLNRRRPISANDLALICLSDYEDATIVTFDYPLMRMASLYGVKCHNPWEKLPHEFVGNWR